MNLHVILNNILIYIITLHYIYVKYFNHILSNTRKKKKVLIIIVTVVTNNTNYITTLMLIIITVIFIVLSLSLLYNTLN